MIWFVLFIWLVSFNQTNETNQMNQITVYYASRLFHSLLKHEAEYSDIHTMTGMDLPTGYQSSPFF